jgi:hypothetical protein
MQGQWGDRLVFRPKSLALESCGLATEVFFGLRARRRASAICYCGFCDCRREILSFQSEPERGIRVPPTPVPG